MVVIYALLFCAFLGLVFGPGMWVAATMRRHGAERPDYPGTVVIQVLTLPTEFNASFSRALPVLQRFIPQGGMKAARSVLTAAALTYVAAALTTLLDITRWLRIIRF